MKLQLATLCAVAVAAMLFRAGDARACGFYAAATPQGIEEALPYLSVEQVLLVWDRDTHVEDFVREARFERADRTFGFVVPTPSRPEVFAVDKSPFASLRGAFAFAPEEIGIGMGHGRLGGGHGGWEGDDAPAPVEMLTEQRIGSFTSFTLAASDATALEKWLADNGFAAPTASRAWLEHFVRMGFFFVALRYEPPGDAGAVTSEMTSETVRIRFSTPAPYYPYREPPRARTQPGTRLLSVWFVSQDEMTPVASSRADGPEPGWAEPWRAGGKYTPGAEFLRGVIPSLAAIVPAAPSLVVQTFHDYKRSRDGWGDAVLVPSKPVTLDDAAILARRPLFAALDPELEPSDVPDASVVDVGDAAPDLSASPSPSDAPPPSATAPASPTPPSTARGCAVGAGRADPTSALAGIVVAFALLALRRRHASAFVAMLPFALVVGCHRESSAPWSPPAPTSEVDAAVAVAPLPSDSPAVAPPSSVAPAPALDSGARARREQALVDLLSGNRSASLKTLEGFAPTIEPSFGRSGGVQAPRIREVTINVNGRLPDDVIRRIARQNFGRFRLCYENGLRSNPNLAGVVAVKFVIGRDGSVMMAADGGSTIPDQGVTSCIVRGFGNLSFPAPEGGIVTVLYKLAFSPGD